MKDWIRVLPVIALLVASGGCSILGGDSESPSSSTADVCDDLFNRFISQDGDGLGVTAEQCNASERGQWIVGSGCYCHGANEG